LMVIDHRTASGDVPILIGFWAATVHFDHQAHNWIAAL
jgi:hypothetical protein